MTTVRDSTGKEITVGTRVSCGDDHGVVVSVSDPDGDVDDYGRTIGINPDVRVTFDDGEEDCFTTSAPRLTWADYPDGPTHWVCDDVTVDAEKKKCGFTDCDDDATVYGGFAGSGDWAGYACNGHSSVQGFQVWDRLNVNQETTR